jgi:hypothetical protein
LTDVRVEPRAHDGFWMRSAYRIPAGAFPSARFPSQEAQETWPITDILVNSLITSHEPGERIRHGERAELRGWAWDGGSGISAVDVSTDNGKSWKAATLDAELGRYAWREFRFPIHTVQRGRISLAVRATSRSGMRQPDTLTVNPAGYHHNTIQRIELEIV